MEAEVRNILAATVLRQLPTDQVAVRDTALSLVEASPELRQRLTELGQPHGRTAGQEAIRILERATCRIDTLQVMRDSAARIGFIEGLEIPARTDEFRGAELG